MEKIVYENLIWLLPNSTEYEQKIVDDIYDMDMLSFHGLLQGFLYNYKHYYKELIDNFSAAYQLYIIIYDIEYKNRECQRLEDIFNKVEIKINLIRASLTFEVNKKLIWTLSHTKKISDYILLTNLYTPIDYINELIFLDQHQDEYIQKNEDNLYYVFERICQTQHGLYNKSIRTIQDNTTSNKPNDIEQHTIDNLFIKCSKLFINHNDWIIPWTI